MYNGGNFAFTVKFLKPISVAAVAGLPPPPRSYTKRAHHPTTSCTFLFRRMKIIAVPTAINKSGIN